ncbi:helix-turn-helix transcriptional regulator [Adlercreutzia sp. R25]|uniref:Helix-turn-helix transcriptional regulator n=1 Tax=Adlercreutzia shanghongiae TaxID=3111773 RepID=A0ABU6IY21_9ACTN|nr:MULTISPECIES: helix-turn-helix transcriptional regulator [unclassified Adlercreutzia]MEC4271731.1 helix-turn-helix transcriptional regulator [Adlercreutzia sp. R25]MEC4294738.1 helix-turn-helix transcriptional regulator [Adlercreutzia sp. R22]
MVGTVARYASGLLWAWGYLVHFAAPGFFAESHLAGVGFVENVYLASALVGYALAALVSETKGRGAYRACSWFGCAAMVAGSAVLVLQGLCGIGGVLLLQSGSVLAGLGLALSATIWGAYLASVDVDALERVALSWCVSFAMVVLVVSLASLFSDVVKFVVYALVIVLPVLSQGGLFSLLRANSLDMASVDETGEGARADRRSLVEEGASLANLFFAFLSLSFVWSAISSLERISFSGAMALFAVAALVLWGVLGIALRNTRRFGLSTLYRWALPFTVISLACASLGAGVAVSVAFAMVFVVNLGFEVTTKLYFIYFGRKWKGHEALAFAFGMAAINVSGLAGSLLWEHLHQLVEAVGFPVAVLFALIPFVVAVSMALGSARPSLAGNAPSVAEEEGKEHAPEPERDPVAPFCASLSETYGLTPREAEVIALLAQGHSRSYVRETLYISKGTVDTHAFHAYAKMGIKTKDDLIKLVHSFEG